ncbi:ankyrin-3-like isoform X2 [Homarus americanus]|uniref:ankyrin-3-like isoform X2 n=1 Tax=Homarus americanus TaxID=6706 RepID=UPI001C45FDAA|nr:ankyrin-3-like isoform X2 [Homarus americanus]
MSSNYFTETLVASIYKNKINEVQKALTKGADVNGGPLASKCPLHYATEANNIPLVKLLLHHNANLEVRSSFNEGATALFLASKAGHLDIIKLLLEAGADVNTLDDRKNGLAQYAAKAGKTQLLNLLSTYGIDLTILDEDQGTLLHLAAENGHLDTCNFLLTKGLSLTYLDKVGQTPADRAQRRNHQKLFRNLKKQENLSSSSMNTQGVDPNRPSQRNARQPLIDNAARGLIRAVKTTLENGDDIHAKSNKKDDHGGRALHLAAGAGYVDVVVELLRHGARVNDEDNLGMTPLHHAAINGHAEVLKKLYAFNPNKEAEDKEGRRAIHIAASEGHLPAVQTLFRWGCSLDPQTKDGSTPLHLATENNKLLVVKWLLDHGVSTTTKNHHQETAEQCAWRKGFKDVMDLLQQRKATSAQLLMAAAEGKEREIEHCVKGGGNIEVCSTQPGEEGLTPLHLACWGGHKDAAVKLINLGANPQALAGGRQAVHWAAYGGHVDVLKALSDLGCDLNVTSADKSTALHLAADNGNLEAVQWLVEHGADIDAKNNKGVTALVLAREGGQSVACQYLQTVQCEEQLMEAAALGETNMVNHLLTTGVSVNATSHKKPIKGSRALHQAADGGHTTLVKVLLQAGAEPSATDDNGLQAVHLATQAGHLPVVKLLMTWLPEKSAVAKGKQLVHWAAIGGHVNILDYLKKEKVNIKSLTCDNESALHLAADNGNLEAVKWLVRMGLSLDQKDRKDFTPDDYALQEGHKEVVAFLRQVVLQQDKFLDAATEGLLKVTENLVNDGVYLDCRRHSDKFGRTALHYAARNGHLEIVRFLLSRGGDPEAEDNFGNTAVHWAAEGGHVHILKVLRDNNCDLSPTNNFQNTPLHCAARGMIKSLGALKWLLDQGVTLRLKNKDGCLAVDVAKNVGNIEAESLIHQYWHDNRKKNKPAITHHTSQQQQERDRSPRRSQQEQQKPKGLASLGNTCYMSSIIQCLYNTSCLTTYFLDDSWRKNINRSSEYGGQVAEAFGVVISVLQARGDTHTAMRAFKSIVGDYDTMFKGCDQQEAHDFLSMLLYALDKDLLQRPGQSHISELFMGLHQLVITCKEKNKIISQVEEQFSNLTLAVEPKRGHWDTCKLEDLLAKYYKPHTIQWECPDCQTTHECYSTTQILQLPQILVLHLSRFNRDSRDGVKLRVTFPPDIPLMTSYMKEGSRETAYSLYGVCYHQGTMSSGHYTATCRDWANKNTWFKFDDERVTNLRKTFPSHEDAHILFYENVGA